MVNTLLNKKKWKNKIEIGKEKKKKRVNECGDRERKRESERQTHYWTYPRVLHTTPTLTTFLLLYIGVSIYAHTQKIYKKKKQ